MPRSPIEDRLLLAIVENLPDHTSILVCRNELVEFRMESKSNKTEIPCIAYRHDVPLDEMSNDQYDVYGPDSVPRMFSLYRNIRILSYRADIAIDYGSGVVVVECDGHDHHERTKQQAAYDRSRDRELLRVGVQTLRFTGSEIFHSAERCASEVHSLLAKLAGDSEAEDTHSQRMWCAAWDKGAARAAAEILERLQTDESVEEHW